MDLPHICFQCDDAPCAAACPVEAITMDEVTGIWHIDRDTCTACGLCVDACPYGAMFMEPEGAYALKCEVCEGQYCKTICPSEAIVHQA
ncbi:4Fe-4S dicluster domain-containing protein [Anoxynatronum sibiricum]|uniref:4Fe-4S dicluster domain-containing protein n=1 Tax=Anoxynatronum sibiricum TaxID=210623 RepID=A0ABU9VNX7_9CLOT